MAYYLTDKQFDEVMRKMFKTAGQEFKSIEESCGTNDWFMQHTWMEKQEAEFRKWFIFYMVKKLHIPVHLADKKARMFLSEYGWKHTKGGEVG